MDITEEELKPYLDKLKKGQRIDRDDLPESLLLLEECISLHPAEYTILFSYLQHKVSKL